MSEDKNWGTARPETFAGVDLATEPDFSVEMVSMPKEEYDRLTAAERERDELKQKLDEKQHECERYFGQAMYAVKERDSLKQQITELDKSTDDLQFKVKAVERLVGVLEKKLAERDAALERAVAAQNSLNIQLDHMKGIWDERGDEIRTLKEQLAEANAELDLNTELMRKQNAACADMRGALELGKDVVSVFAQFVPDHIRDAKKHIEFINTANHALSSSAGRDLLERVRLLEKDKEMAKKLLEHLRDRADAVISNDKTRYDHHEPRPDGKQPREDGGTCWLTPKELAHQMLSAIDAYLKRGGKDA